MTIGDDVSMTSLLALVNDLTHIVGPRVRSGEITPDTLAVALLFVQAWICDGIPDVSRDEFFDELREAAREIPLS